MRKIIGYERKKEEKNSQKIKEKIKQLQKDHSTIEEDRNYT